MEKSMLNCVSVNLSKCDNLIKKRDGPLVDGDAEANNIFFQQPHIEVKSTSMKMNPHPPPSRTMSIKDVFHLAITDAKNENPKEFRLPAEYLTNSNLNVTIQEKDPDGLLNDMDSNNDVVEQPARQCYYCKRTCSDGEIISCHFCPGSFHINCLSPPLCCVPDAKWMCPLHPHHILDKIMNRSCSITELSFWVNKVAAPTNDKSVEIDFIEKTKRLRKEQSKKIVKCYIKIPDIIKYHYEHPSTPASLLDKSNNPKQYCSRNESILASYRHWSRCREKENGYAETNTNTARNDHPRNGTLIEIVNEDNVPPNVDPYASEKCKSTTYEDFSLWDKENRKFKFTSCGIYDGIYNYEQLGTQFPGFTAEHFSDPKLISVHESSSPTPVEWRSFNSKPSSWKRLQEILDRGIQNSFIDGMPMSFGNGHASALRERLKKFKLHSTIRTFPPSFKPKTLPYPFLNTLLLEKPVKKTHAVLCPLSHQAPPVFMYHNTLNIGTDIFNDVYLTNYGNCNFLSKSHATIFYDEFTKTYELLNYSVFNCVVDGVCYTNDLSAKTCDPYFKRKRNENEVDPNLREVVNRKVIPKRKSTKTFDYIGKRRLVASSNNNEPTDKKRFNSSIPRERESRFVHKRLLQDIEKLVTKSQKEMNVIADEDLNEISKILKSKKPCPSALVDEEIEHKENPHTVFIIKRKRKIFPDRTGDRSFFNGNRKMIRKKGARNMPYEIQPDEMQENKTPQYSVMNSSSENKFETDAKKDEEIRAKMRSSPSINCQNNNLGESVNQSFYHCDFNETDLLKREERCKCRALNLKMPVGRDSSWEVSASLHHGSHIRFGCIEFVFCIVNHPPTFEERSYVREKVPPALDEPSKISSCDEITVERIPKNEDLSSKLTSILSVLSSESEMGDESSYSLPVMINANHDFGGRFEIDKSGSVFGSERLSNEETSSMSSDAVSILSDFHHSEESENQGKKKQ